MLAETRRGLAESAYTRIHARPLRMVLVWAALTLVCGQLYNVTFAPDLGWVHLNEDQMISMRVAWTLMETGEPYFNLGDPVAASTSLFWMYPLSLAHLLTPSPNAAVLAVYWASTAAYVGTAFWVATHLRDLVSQAATLVLILFSGSGLIYGGSGWEHVPQSILVTLGFLEILRGATRERWLRAFYLLSLSFLARPDSAPTIAVFFVAGLVTLGVKDRLWFGVRCLPAALLPVAYVLAMLHFYDDVVPNTFYLKDAAGGARVLDGIDYVLDPRRSGFAPIFCAFLVICWHRLNVTERTVVSCCAAHAAFVVWIGGDVYNDGRFFLIYLPVMALMFMRHIATLGFGKAGLALSIVLAALPIHGTLSQAARSYKYQIVSQLRLADKVAQNLSPDDGAVGLHYLGVAYRLLGFQVVDFFGKADPFVAHTAAKAGKIGHNKWDYNHSIDGFDLAVVFIPDNLVEEAGQEKKMDDGDTHGVELVQKIWSTQRFTYLGPADLCVDSGFGLFVRKDLARNFQVASCAT